MSGTLPSWRDGAAKQAITDFVARALGLDHDDTIVRRRLRRSSSSSPTISLRRASLRSKS
jgi:hypothetical protein